ncbi:hypothetical protein [Roseomonas chloroacetimidivorans]|uniref:hypothetical protein n=1 Tax=Roseomonas chloroacetimidivorans TaxID=1766656 RepID=UPI003C78B884
MRGLTAAARAYDAERLLKLFHQFGPDGRAISASSLLRHAGFESNRARLAAALEHLLEAGMIRQAGADPLAREPAFRLARPIASAVPEEQRIAA